MKNFISILVCSVFLTSCQTRNISRNSIMTAFQKYQEFENTTDSLESICPYSLQRFFSVLSREGWLLLPGDSVWACLVEPGAAAFRVDSCDAECAFLESGKWMFVLDTFTRMPPLVFVYDGKTGDYEKLSIDSGIYDAKIVSINIMENNIVGFQTTPKHLGEGLASSSPRYVVYKREEGALRYLKEEQSREL